MGNENSGRWFSVDVKTTVAECYALDILEWHREGLFEPGICHSGLWGWRDARKGEVVYTIGYGIDMRQPHAQISHTDARLGRYTNYRVDLVPTRPNYGGQRWWFVCPGVQSGRACGRKVRKLYLEPGQEHFACRRCCDLRYVSQREDYPHRAMSKAQAIRVRLGGSAAMGQEFPPKPKRMRWNTYRWLRARSEELWVESLKAALRLPAD